MRGPCFACDTWAMFWVSVQGHAFYIKPHAHNFALWIFVRLKKTQFKTHKHTCSLQTCHLTKCNFFIVFFLGIFARFFRLFILHNSSGHQWMLKMAPSKRFLDFVDFSCGPLISPAGIYPLKINNRNTGKRCEVCSKLTIKTPERRYRRRSGVFIVNLYIFHTLFQCFYC